MSLQYYDDTTGQLVEQIDLGGVAQESSVQNLVTLVAALQNRGTVKTVQRGSKTFSPNSIGSSDVIVNVSISAVNIDKTTCMSVWGYDSYRDTFLVLPEITSSTNLRLHLYNYNTARENTVKWEIVEFY